jgi:hypothetical protein
VGRIAVPILVFCTLAAACLPEPWSKSHPSKSPTTASSSPASSNTVATTTTTAATTASSAPTPTPTSSTTLQPAKPPFGYYPGSPHDFFANDPDAVARWLQREHTPGWGVRADVAAGPENEWLVDVFQYALIVSPDVGGFWYRDFGTGDVTDMQARPLTRSAKKDIVARFIMKQGEFPSGYRHEILEVWSFGLGGPVVRFSIEIGATAMCCGSEANAPPHASSDVTLTDDTIEIKPHAPWRVDPAKFKPAVLPDIWPRVPNDVKKRVYKWDGTKFAVDKEER